MMGKVLKVTWVTKPEQLRKVEGGQTSILMGKNLRTNLQNSLKKNKKYLKN